VRLDTFCEQNGARPNVVKLDVEGAELRVLEGMAGLFAAGCPDALLVETHDTVAPAGSGLLNASVFALLAEHGFDLFLLARGAWAPLRDAAEMLGRCHILALRPGTAAPRLHDGSR